MEKKKQKEFEFVYAASTRRALIVITAILALLIPLSIADRAAWVGRFPMITVVLVPIVLVFIWIIWQDGSQKIIVSKKSIVCETGAGRRRKVVEIPWNEILELRDSASVFSNTRKYDIVSAADESCKIRINSSYACYKDLLKIVIARLPSARIHERARKSLKRMHVM